MVLDLGPDLFQAEPLQRQLFDMVPTLLARASRLDIYSDRNEKECERSE